jgi:hypothetical protein
VLEGKEEEAMNKQVKNGLIVFHVIIVVFVHFTSHNNF